MHQYSCSASGSRVARVVAVPGAPTYLNKPVAMDVNPLNTNELWVVNQASDSISVLNLKAPVAVDITPKVGYATTAGGHNLQDAYAEHFMPRTIGIAFNKASKGSSRFATVGDDNNQARIANMAFPLAPTLPMYTQGNGYSGATLWSSTSFAQVCAVVSFVSL